jgi:hypothetical protein
MVPSISRVTLKRLARPILKAGTVVLGAGMSLAIATTNAFALETIVLKLPAIGDLNITLDELKTFAETGEASGDFGALLDDPTVAENLSREDLRKILNEEFMVGARAASAVDSALGSCPVELLLGALSEVVYSGSQGSAAPWSAAISATMAGATSEPVSVIEVLDNFSGATLTVDVPAALQVYNSVKDKVQPMVDTIGNLTVRELTSIDQAKLEELFDKANIADSDRQKIEAAIAAFGSLEPGSDIDQILSQINFGSLLQKAVSGNIAGILSEIETINFGSVDLGPYEARISNLMIAFMDVLGVPVNQGAECSAVL